MSKVDKDEGILKPRDVYVDDTTPVRRQPAKKDTKRWCKGKVGREHQIETALDPASAAWQRECQWNRGWAEFLACRHVKRCIVCSKIVQRWLPKEECPDAPREDPERDVG